MDGLCRCCLTKSFVKDLKTSYVWLDKHEVYSDMLKECFNIVLTHSEKYGICTLCITQLRNALRFKQQVILAEQDFVKRLLSSEKNDERPLFVKLEPKNESDDDSDDYFLADAARVVEVKSESESEPRRKRSVRGGRGRGGGSGSGSGARALGPRARLAATGAPCDVPNNEVNPIKVRKRGNTELDLWKSPKHDKRKHRENLQTILQYSTAVPFKNKSLLGFICGYCDAPFPDPADLRIHTEKEHKKERLNFKNNFDMTEYNVKLDVNNLTCTLCEEKVDNLNLLKVHLVKQHSKVIYSDIKDHILQFKLKKGEVYDCALCSSTYETFKMLKQHMNKHYTNYSCNKCDNSFATKRSLNSHRTTHQKGSFKCQHCEKVFPTKAKQHYHEKTKHLGARSISNCPYCNEPFRSYYQRNQHLIRVHNLEAQYKCNVCSKSYILKSLLMYHIKKTHLMERNHQCTECGYKFFSKKALSAHMVKHTGEKKYSCEVCHKAYARKYTLREHMRIHNNDRRFRCEVCAMTFVQKCSLKSHLLSNHGISMAASDIASI